MIAEQRFWSKVQKSDGCWRWTGGRARGYGQFWDGERHVLAHRFSYMQLVGPIPIGLELDHLCRNRPCVNPDHLEAVTTRENLVRGNGWSGRNARKTHCVNGHPFSVENTYPRPGPREGRDCRICRREIDRRRNRPRVVQLEYQRQSWFRASHPVEP